MNATRAECRLDLGSGVTPGADMSRALISAIERSEPGAVYVEHDEEGRARAVRLELAPRPESLAAAISAVAEESPRSRAETIDACMSTLRDARAGLQKVDVEVGRINHARSVGAISWATANDLVKVQRKREVELWARIEGALEKLYDEAAPL